MRPPLRHTKISQQSQVVRHEPTTSNPRLSAPVRRAYSSEFARLSNTGACPARGRSCSEPSIRGFDLTAVYTQPSVSNVSIDSLYHDARRPAFVLIDELLAKNFAVLGATGSGKSCAVTLMLSAILTDHPNAHIVVLDPHNEYARAFGQLAEVVSVDNLQLPLWLFDFEEAVGALVRGGTAQEQEAQTIILKEAITRARRRHLREDLAAASITVDTPMPFGAVDLLRFIDEAMGTARCCRY